MRAAHPAWNLKPYIFRFLHNSGEVEMYPDTSPVGTPVDAHEITKLVHDQQAAAAVAAPWRRHPARQRVVKGTSVVELADQNTRFGPRRHHRTPAAVLDAVAGKLVDRDGQLP